jgi:hypothetical protein
MKRGARLLVVEMVLPPGNTPSVAKLLDHPPGGGHGALPQFVLQIKTHPQTLFIQNLTTHQTPSDCRTPREI